MNSVIGYETDRIESIEQINLSSRRYDITVEENHNFFANDILVHNCQNLPKVLDMTEMTFERTVKLNGSSMTVFYQTKYPDNIEGVCSRNLQLKLEQEGNTFVDVTKREGILEKLKAFNETTGRSIAIQGELVGEGIQKNYENLKGHEFYVFDVFDVDTGKYLLPIERRALVEELGLKHVPVLDESATMVGYTDLAQIIAAADGPSINVKVREGDVYKANELYRNNDFSFKAISNLYLLKHDTD